MGNRLVILAMLFAASGTQASADESNPTRDAKALQAEIQIGLCAPTDEIVQVLDLRPRGAPITVWQFDDSALTLLSHGVRLRLRVAADGHSVLTLKVADQDCARLNPKLVPPREMSFTTNP